jgi:hypothetical protein
MNNDELIRRLEEIRKCIKDAYMLSLTSGCTKNLAQIAQIVHCFDMLDKVICDLIKVQ